jgi:hypothetical protein
MFIRWVTIVWVPCSLFKYADAFFYGSNERVDFFFRVIESEGGSNRPRNLEEIHQRLGTMVTCSHGNSLFIK